MSAEQKKEYRVKWHNTVNGRSGFGPKLYTKEECQALCDELNEEYTDFTHTPEKVT